MPDDQQWADLIPATSSSPGFSAPRPAHHRSSACFLLRTQHDRRRRQRHLPSPRLRRRKTAPLLVATSPALSVRTVQTRLRPPAHCSLASASSSTSLRSPPGSCCARPRRRNRPKSEIPCSRSATWSSTARLSSLAFFLADYVGPVSPRCRSPGPTSTPPADSPQSASARSSQPAPSPAALLVVGLRCPVL